MKTFVVFIKSDLYDKDSFKCIVSSINKDNIILAHKQIYPDVSFQVTQQIPIYDEFLFNYFISKVPQYKSAFVTVSFNDTFENSKYESSKIPSMVFTNEQYDIIIEIIEYINKLSALLPLDNDTILNSNNLEIENDNFIINKFEGNGNGNGSIHLENISGFTDDNPQEEYNNLYAINDFEYTDLFYIHNKFNNQSVKYIIMNKGYTFNGLLFKKLFPELEINIFSNFANIPLAEKMFEYQINLYEGSLNCIENLKDILENINEFLQNSKVQSIKISDIKDPLEDKEDLNVHMTQYNTIKEFVNLKCVSKENTSVQSKILFDNFTTFCKETGQEVMSHTKFSKLFKQATFFESTRKSNGIYFLNLELKK